MAGLLAPNCRPSALQSSSSGSGQRTTCAALTRLGTTGAAPWALGARAAVCPTLAGWLVKQLLQQPSVLGGGSEVEVVLLALANGGASRMHVRHCAGHLLQRCQVHQNVTCETHGNSGGGGIGQQRCNEGNAARAGGGHVATCNGHTEKRSASSGTSAGTTPYHRARHVPIIVMVTAPHCSCTAAWSRPQVLPV